MLSSIRVYWLSLHVILQIIFENFLLIFVFENYAWNLQVWWNSWLLMNLRSLPLIILIPMRSLRSMLTSFMKHLPGNLGYVLLDSQLVFKQSCSQNTKLDEVHVLLEFFQKSINDSQSKRMIFPNLYLLSPENQIGLRTSIWVAKKSIFGQVAKDCPNQCPSVLIVRRSRDAHELLNLLLQVSFV